MADETCRTAPTSPYVFTEPHRPMVGLTPFDQFAAGYKISEVTTGSGVVFYLNFKQEAPGRFKGFQATATSRDAIERQLALTYGSALMIEVRGVDHVWHRGLEYWDHITVQRANLADIERSHRAFDRAKDSPGFPIYPTDAEATDGLDAMGIWTAHWSCMRADPPPVPPMTKEFKKECDALGVPQDAFTGATPGWVTELTYAELITAWKKREWGRRMAPFWSAHKVHLTAIRTEDAERVVEFVVEQQTRMPAGVDLLEWGLKGARHGGQTVLVAAFERALATYGQPATR